MKNIALFVAVVFAVIAVQAAKPEIRGQWKLRSDLGRAPGDSVLPLSIALRQKNLDILKVSFGFLLPTISCAYEFNNFDPI
jgi:hypothetical protein